MTRILINISKYVMIFLMLVYTFLCFNINASGRTEKLRSRYAWQNIITMTIYTMCSAIILYHKMDVNLLIFVVLEFIYLILLVVLYRLFYPESSRLLVNNMAMLLALGFVMVERLNPESAFKQCILALIGTIISFFIPKIMCRRRFLIKIKWLYPVIGLILLSVTLILGKTTLGANLSINIAGFSFQPSEFVKLIYVLYVAAMLCKAKEFRNIVISALLAALHVLILIASNDLGTALIFFVVYIVMLYISTGKPFYLIAGIACGCAAAVLAYKAFSHVRVRINAWRDPWSIIDTGGYQITQSLFAIGTGGWFGLGLYEGTPGKIPVAVKDFVFSAISEEFGMIFALCVALICFNCFIVIMRIATRSRDVFYKLIAVGFGTLYIFQCFLTIGGVTKFIPSTGVTLPFVSYGGSSILCSLMMFAMVQAVFILVRENEDDVREVTEKIPKEQAE